MERFEQMSLDIGFSNNDNALAEQSRAEQSRAEECQLIR